MKDRLKSMEQCLMSMVEKQVSSLDQTDAKELEAVINSIHYLEEAIYYCTITKAMEEKKDDHNKYYTDRMTYIPYDYNRDMDRNNGRMYYDGYPMGGAYNMYNNNGGNSSSSSNGSSSRGYSERELPIELRDYREGRSGRSRKTYMEAKEMHQDKNVHLKELEKYMTELSQDITEMIGNASPEEKQLLEKKMTALASKISATHA